MPSPDSAPQGQPKHEDWGLPVLPVYDLHLIPDPGRADQTTVQPQVEPAKIEGQGEINGNND